MRAFIAILKDSFREAMASRVLWIALIVISLALLALVPIGIRTDRSLKLRQQEMLNAESMLSSLSQAGTSGKTAQSVIWNQLSTEQKEKVKAWLDEDDQTPQAANRRDGNGRSLRNQVIRMLNALIIENDFDQDPVWQQADLDEDTQTLRDAAPTSEDDRRFLKLKLLQAAFPNAIAIKDDPAIIVTYAGSDMTDPIDVLPSQFERLLDGIIIGVLSVFLGFFGVFGSLLVTASIIPRTFEPGEISLLLSKPISRTLLFLTKFLGGCMFTLLCAALLVGGVWLILGTRLNTWRQELLWCIPVYVFLFAIYFSVSAVSGAIWRNANVSLILVVVFWVALFTIGTTRTVITENVIKSRSIGEITMAQNETFVVDGSRTVYQWDVAENDWTEVFASQGQGVPRFVQRLMFSGTRFNPVYDAANDRILALQPEPSRFCGLAPAMLVSGDADGGWERENEGRPPEVVLDLLIDADGRVILPARRKIYEFVGQSEQQKKTQEYLGNILGGLIKPAARQAFSELQTENLPAWSDNASACLDAATGDLLVHDKDTIYKYVRNDEGKYQADATRTLEDEQSGLIAATANTVLVATADGAMHLLDAATLQDKSTAQLPTGEVPLRILANPRKSQIGLLTHQGNLTIWDCQQATFSEAATDLSGRISAVSIDSDGNWMLANGRRTIFRLENSAAQPEVFRGGKEDWVYTVFDWVLDPLYSILPRPSDMDNAVRYLITGERTVVIDDSGDAMGSADTDNLKKDRVTFEVWRPIATNAIFISVVLMIGCIYIKFYDF